MDSGNKNTEELKGKRQRIRSVSQNFFLHIHAPKIEIHTLKPTFTFGLGVISVSLFLILLITGLLLMLYYTPSVDQAYQSVKDIIYLVPGGRYIRNMHRWASHGMVLVAFLHLLRVFYTGAYYGSRKTNWIIGIVMLLVTVLLSFSGYLLPWDQLAYWAVTIGSNIAASVREFTDMIGITDSFDVGGFIKRLLIGAEDVGQPALTRFYMMHIVLLPVGLLVLMGYHFWRIRKDGGLSHPKELINEEKRTYSWPSVMWAELAILLTILTVLLLISVFIDGPLKEPANISFPENPAKSPWYLLGIQELVSYSAFTGGWILPTLFLVFLFSIPYYDKNDNFKGVWFSGKKGLKLTLISILISFVATILFVGISVGFGWIKDWFPSSPMVFSMIVNPASLVMIIFILWSIWIKKRTSSYRMAAIALFTCSIVSLLIFTVIGIWFRGPDWTFVWPF